MVAPAAALCTDYSNASLIGLGWHGYAYSLNASAVVKVIRAGGQLARRLKWNLMKESSIRRSNASLLVPAQPLERAVPLRQIAIARLLGEAGVGPTVFSAGECETDETPNNRYFAMVTERMDGGLDDWLARGEAGARTSAAALAWASVWPPPWPATGRLWSWPVADRRPARWRPLPSGTPGTTPGASGVT